tara:strand:- start:957 stop:1706 length:750 start_codon:yes stop_codon:yes gene_type:complete
MAFLGGLGKALGFGSTQQVVTGLTGSKFIGAVAGQAAKGLRDIQRTQQTQQGQATAVSIPQAPPAETAMSGEVGIPASSPVYAPTFVGGATPAAFAGPAPAVPMTGGIQQAAVPAIIGGGVAVSRGMLGAFLSGAAAGITAPTIIDPFTGQEKKLRVTRRLRSQVKRAVEMFGVDQVANQMGVDIEVIFYILTKRMRNDGPYVTKAAVRKTRQTVRKMKRLCDMYDDLRPAARRAPARRTTSKTTLIKN